MIEKSEAEILEWIAQDRKRGDRMAEARDTGLLASKYKEEGKFQQAIDAWEREKQIRLSLGDCDGAAYAIFGIAHIYWAKPSHPYPGLGNPRLAITYAEQALRIATSNKVKATILNSLSGMYARLGNLEQAIRCYDLCISYDPTYEISDRNESIQVLEEMARQGYV